MLRSVNLVSCSTLQQTTSFSHIMTFPSSPFCLSRGPKCLVVMAKLFRLDVGLKIHRVRY